jgi:hypothetical protein
MDPLQALVERINAAEAKASRVAKILNQQLDAYLKDWPPEVKLADPGPDDVEVRVRWAEKMAPLAARLKQGGGPVAPATESGKGRQVTPRSKPQPPEDGRLKEATHAFQKPGDVAW